MLNRKHCISLLMLNNRLRDSNHPIGYLPREIAAYMININYDQNPYSDIAIALRLAASGLEDDLVALAKMVEANPRLLLQAGDVVTRGGFFAARKTLYEFFLGEEDPVGAKRIEFGFAEIPGGEKVRVCQYEAYRPHIESLAKQVTSKIPTYNLEPLFEIIIESSSLDIKAALNKNFKHESMLNDAMRKFRDAVKLKRKTGGMHYEHHPTLMQAFDLRRNKWKELSNNYKNFDKCDLVWRQIIGLLQLHLPGPYRFGFARAFDDEERTVKCKYAASGSFPNAQAHDDSNFSGIGFDEAIYGRVQALDEGLALRLPWVSFETACLAKLLSLQKLCSPSQGISLSR